MPRRLSGVMARPSLPAAKTFTLKLVWVPAGAATLARRMTWNKGCLELRVCHRASGCPSPLPSPRTARIARLRGEGDRRRVSRAELIFASRDAERGARLPPFVIPAKAGIHPSRSWCALSEARMGPRLRGGDAVGTAALCRLHDTAARWVPGTEARDDTCGAARAVVMAAGPRTVGTTCAHLSPAHLRSPKLPRISVPHEGGVA